MQSTALIQRRDVLGCSRPPKGATIRRREFITLLGGTAAGWPLSARAQQASRVYRIAYLSVTLSVEVVREHPFVKDVLRELGRLGYAQGRNLKMEFLSAEGRPDRFASIVAQAIDSKPDAILAASSGAILQVLKDSTNTIPIVIYTGDPVEQGLVASVARPGGNITGVSSDTGIAVFGKYVEILKEINPAIARVAMLSTRADFEGVSGTALRQFADRFGVSIVGPPLDGSLEEDFRRAFAAMEKTGIDALIVTVGPENVDHRSLILEFAEKNRLPAVYPFQHYAKAGGLLSYAIDSREMIVHLAACIARVLKGDDPAEIPIYQSTKLQLTINLKTAAKIGVTIPPALLARADEVIE